MNYKVNEVPERVIKTRDEWAESDAKRDAGLTEPEDIKAIRDLSYGPYDKWNLLDVYRPIAAEGKLPVIMNIHGGGYFYGDKELYRFYCMRMAQGGFAVVNFNYRLAPEFNFPSPLEDASRVLKWIDDNADEYGLDKENVFIIGDSAGAQLASQYAAIHTNPEYAALFPFNTDNGCKVRAVGLACGVYRIEYRIKHEKDGYVFSDYLGGKTDMHDPILDMQKYVTSNYPPAYIFSSHCDFLLEECGPFKEFLEEKGVDVESHIYGTPEAKEIAHVFHCNLRLEEGEKANLAQIDFFKRHIVI